MINKIVDTITKTAQQTEQLGASLAQLLKDDSSLPRFIALYGDLGVGKTAFVRGFVSAFSPAAVRSPTFALVNEYPSADSRIFHFDMYRITDEDDLYSIGYYDYLDSGICLVEWSENIPYAIPERHIRVSIGKVDASSPDDRSVKIDSVG